MMAPVVIALGEASARLGLAGDSERLKPPFPWFLVAFLALAAFNSLVAVPREIAAAIGVAATFLLSMAMARWGCIPTSAGCARAASGRSRSACSPRCSSAVSLC